MVQTLPTLDKLDITTLKGVGSRLAETLAKLGITSVQDMLFHLPIRYLDRTRITPIGHLRTNSSVVIQGRVLESKIMFGKRRSLAVTLEDNTGGTCLRFYHFNAAQKNQFSPGQLVRCFGDPRLGASGLEFYHPEYELVDEARQDITDDTLTPVYGLTEGISQARLRALAQQAVTFLKNYQPQEFLPAEINARFGVHSLSEALAYLHFPPPEADISEILEGQHPSQLRLAFEEMLAHFLVRQKLRAQTQKHRAPAIPQPSELRERLLSNLPFNLTAAQQRVSSEVLDDLSSGVPMLRMVQGDVGSGKTLVAALASLDTVSSGYQVAVAAPTEILAEQHFKNFLQWLTPLGIQVTWLVGKLKTSLRRQAISDIADGSAQVVVGTHALFQEDVNFAQLGLAIIDEQHRFGVDQRLSLRKPGQNGEIPHQLVMTATPIPRTLAMTAYSELDYSVIDELPPGRIPIKTALVSQGRKDQVIERIQHVCQTGTQAYWVCPLVEDSETLSVANAEETSTLLQEHLTGIKVGLVHGRLKPTEKEAVMADFKAGDTQLLVATTVIEVGVDVPNATLMIIENPERLGLAQLHQLRGRVGRGQNESHCVLLYGDKLSEQAKSRLQVLRESSDGFVIAEKDLELRGPGELLGTRQTGDMSYRIADVQQHAHLIELVQSTGQWLFGDSPDTCNALIHRWVGEKQQYAHV